MTKRMPAEDDRTFLTRRFEKLLTEKVASSRSHRYRKPPGFVPVVELNRYASRERMHFKSGASTDPGVFTRPRARPSYLPSALVIAWAISQRESVG